jgi:glycosyltransferase involved in cell wall biosynthesis
MIQPHVVTVVISKCLLNFLSQHHQRPPANPLVLHDAAPVGIKPIHRHDKKQVLKELFPKLGKILNGSVVGYFGQLYAGRGLSIIEQVAEKFPEVTFLVFGGNPGDVDIRRKENRRSNLIYMGYVSHPVSQKSMAACDVLLMPYQQKVSIGVRGHDTARWMSPMKLFEYLASGTPVISSDLPPLREVLYHGFNAMLVAPEDPQSWCDELSRLLDNPDLAQKIGRQGYQTYSRNHTWTIRAKSLIEAINA